MKRQPTAYNVLIQSADQPETLTHVGRVNAFTPSQARSRAAKSITAIKRAARQNPEKAVTVVTVPATSMNPTRMTFGPTKEKPSAERNPV